MAESKKLEVCILAAGVGSRMRSTTPKVLQTLAGRPLLSYLLDTVAKLSPARIHVIVGQGAEEVQAAFSDRDDIHWVYQAERLGTGHAMQQVAPSLESDSKTLVLLGDAPLIEVSTLSLLTDQDASLSVLSVDMEDPFGYGRIVRDGHQVTHIVEQKDADATQQLIQEINTGVMAADSSTLVGWLSKLDNNNAQKEFLLTDIVEHANTEGLSVSALKTNDPSEVAGINTFVQLAELERSIQLKNAHVLMEQGVQMMDPTRFDLRGELSAGTGVTIDINTVFEGNVELGDQVNIGANCIISNATIGHGSVIKPNSVIDGASIGENCSVGPFARLRPGAVLSNEVAVGNFVEIKKSTLGVGSKASHLTYLGDATIGASVNIGAGTITCNYDGVNKFETHIKDGAFIGSNSSLVAPVVIGRDATIGAGSTITKEVSDNDLAIGRGRQTSINNWQRPTKKK